jgi:hypothetical protein
VFIGIAILLVENALKMYIPASWKEEKKRAFVYCQVFRV